jgi:hypothetical protein
MHVAYRTLPLHLRIPCLCAAVLGGMLGVADAQVQASAAACLAALSIEVDSKVPAVAAAAPALIKLAQEGGKVRSLNAAAAWSKSSCVNLCNFKWRWQWTARCSLPFRHSSSWCSHCSHV